MPELAERIAKFRRFSSEKQLAQLAEDSAFALEVQAQSTLAAQSVRQQVAFKRKLFTMFSQGRVPRFTFTVVERNQVASESHIRAKASTVSDGASHSFTTRQEVAVALSA